MIGGGLCGLTAAIRLAEAGFKVELFEAAPKPGGRTRSFIDKTTGELCDNGPHLLIGAYQATQQLLSDCHAAGNITWQTSLKLPLWDKQRDSFQLAPVTWLPFPLALLWAVKTLPGHGWRSAFGMLRLAATLHKKATDDNATVADLIRLCRIPAALVRDMLEPICFGAMNEGVESANATSFRRVLKESFASRTSARLGWFNKPLDEALIQPLVLKAEQLGVNITTGHRVRSLQPQTDGLLVNDVTFDAAVIALPAYATDALLGQASSCETRCITNVHLWYKDLAGLSEPLVGGIATTGHWFFDVSAQMHHKTALRHICVVISAESDPMPDELLVEQLNHELNVICGTTTHTPSHYRLVREKRATVLVRAHEQLQMPSNRIINASESPRPGDLPATIEFAVLRGENAALTVANLLV